jgi:hypothetical protein
MLRGIFLLWVALAAAGGALAADVAGTVTILEGEALIVRAATRVRAAEGVRLQLGDILETGDATFVQVELVDQTVMQMGPKSRVMVGGAVRLKAERTLYALSGWFKLSNARNDGNVRAFEFRSPLIEIGLLPGVVVMQLKTNEATLFAERGDLKLVERPGGPAVGVRQGQTYRRTAGARGTLGGTAPAAFVAEMPKAFRDSLPLRADKYREREVQPRAAPDFAYADVGFDGYRPPSILQAAGAKEVAVELYTLTKSFSMAGWRVGFLLGNAEVVGALAKLKSYLDYGTFQPIQIAATVVMNELPDYPKEANEIYRSRRDTLVDGLVRVGWEIEKPKGTMFVWAPIPEPYEELGSLEFAKLLVRDAKVAVSPGMGFGPGGEGYVRFALVENEQRISQAVRGIRRALPKLG